MSSLNDVFCDDLTLDNLKIEEIETEDKYDRYEVFSIDEIMVYTAWNEVTTNDICVC